MGLTLATTFGLAVWIVMWATGSNAIDGFMITTTIVVVAAAVRMIAHSEPVEQ